MDAAEDSRSHAELTLRAITAATLRFSGAELAELRDRLFQLLHGPDGARARRRFTEEQMVKLRNAWGQASSRLAGEQIAKEEEQEPLTKQAPAVKRMNPRMKR
jgi:hypothetical protein